MKSPASKEESPISSFPRDVPAAQLWWTQPIYSWSEEDGLKSLDKRSNDTTVQEAEIKFKLLKKEKN